MAAGLGVAYVHCASADPLRPTLPTILVSSTVLSDAFMARQTGSGVGPQDVVNGPAQHPSVTLWDEIKVPAQIIPPTNGAVTGAPSGGAR